MITVYDAKEYKEKFGKSDSPKLASEKVEEPKEPKQTKTKGKTNGKTNKGE